MKKIINLIMIVGAVGLLLPACDLDKRPTNAISSVSAFETMTDAENHIHGLYAQFRRCFYGIFSQTTEIMSDLYNPHVNYGNNGGLLHRLDETMPRDYSIRDIWLNCYVMLADVNNVLERIGEVNTTGKDEAATKKNRATIQNYIAHAHYIRAHLYYILIKHFGADYEPATATTDPGVPVVSLFRVYDKPARHSVDSVYKFIMAEIALADSISEIKSGDVAYATKDAVLALKSKIQLSMHDFAGAAETALGLINSGKYRLVTSEAALRACWAEDKENEDIYTLFVSGTETAENQGVYERLDIASGRYSPSWIPTQTVVDFYQPRDLRRQVYLSDTNSVVWALGANHPARFVTKWPMTSQYVKNSYLHAPKVARIAEQYLIAAEALSHTDEAQALTILNEFRVARGASLLTEWDQEELQKEWVREMIGEGVRIECLKRWGLGFNGREPQDSDIIAGGEAQYEYSLRVCPPNYYRFTLPIPVDDLLANPNLKQTPEWITLLP